MTATADRLDLLTGIGLRWKASGQAGLAGPLLRLVRDLDQALLVLAESWDAQEEQHSATLSADLLDRLGYLRSFPHQATFAVRLDPDKANVDEFLAGPVIADDAVALSRPAPVTEVLTPAACYHLYDAHHGDALSAPLYLTTRNTCFRQEREYQPLRRQWSFSMREIVCLGTESETALFLGEARGVVDRFVELIDLPLDWAVATDPFFRPDTDPRHLLQKVMPIKHEAGYGTLAVASLNRHFEHFGEISNITRDGAPVQSACAAFGIERWLYAITDRHGMDPAAWPKLAAAASQVRAEHGGDR